MTATIYSVNQNTPIDNRTRVNFPSETSNLTSITTPATRVAAAFGRAGLAVFPISPRMKAPTFKWGRLRNTRLPDRTPDGLGLFDLIDRFDGQVNLCLMTGRASVGLVVLDCDDVTAYQHIAGQLTARGIPIRGARTRRGAHIYLRVRGSEIESRRIGSIEIKAAGGYVVAPPSIHPTGYTYQFLEGTDAGNVIDVPTIDLEHIAGLTAPDGQPIPFKRTGRRTLKTSTTEFLLSGAPEGQRNNALFDAAVDYHHRGYELTRAYSELGRAARQSGMSENEIKTTIASAYKRPSRPAEITPAPHQVNLEMAAAAACQRAGIPSGRLKSRAAVLAALWPISHYRGQSPARFTASQRLISEKTGIANRRVIQKALLELERVGLIAPAGVQGKGITELYPGDTGVPLRPDSADYGRDGARPVAEALISVSRPKRGAVAYWSLKWRPEHAENLPKGIQHSVAMGMSLLGYLLADSDSIITRAGLIDSGLSPVQVDHLLQRTDWLTRVGRGRYVVNPAARARALEAEHERRELKRQELRAQHYQERCKWIAQDIEKALHTAARAATEPLPVAAGAEGQPIAAPAPRHSPKRAIFEPLGYDPSGGQQKTPENGHFESVSRYNPFSGEKGGST